MTLENWQLVLFSGIRSFGAWSVIYFLSWIFIGNFVLLNLFLAILLDSFLDEDEEFTKINKKESEREFQTNRTVSLEKLKSALSLPKSPVNQASSSTQ